jgi:hypothetical protein
MQYIEKNFMEVDYNTLVQNHVYYNMLSQKNHLNEVVVQWLRIWFFNVEVRSSIPHIYNLGYFDYLGDLIK